jgi:hypothetical protein
MEQSRQEIIEITDKMMAMRPDIEKELQRNYPNVSSVEVGLKRKEGGLTDILAFRVIVTKKVDERELKPEEMIPKEIRGYPTDVLVEQMDFECDDSRGYDLLTGGIQINIGIGAGTLGCFVTRDAEPVGSKKIYLLSNYHVIIGKNGQVGTRVGQPSPPSGCKNCSLCWDIAEVFCGEKGGPTGPKSVGTVLTPPGSPNAIDAAIAKLLGQDAADPKIVYFSNSIEGIGPVFGSSTTVVPKDRVRKRGRTTGLTYGIIEATGATSKVKDEKNDPTSPDVIYSGNVYKITPMAENKNMGNEGDSGSVLVDRQNRVVALIFSVPRDPNAPTTGPFKPNGEARAFPIGTVMTRLGISVLSSGTANSIPLSGVSADEIKPVRAGSYVYTFEKQLKSIPEGEFFVQVLLDHRNEVMDLINDNREVKLAWHRLNGPEYLGHILKNAGESQHPIPPEINGYSLQNLLIKMADVLERNGSRKLAKAVDDYSEFVFNFADKYKGPHTLKDALRGFSTCPACGKTIHSNAHA